MNNILVSGASGIVGYGILRSLKKHTTPLRLIGTSIYTDSAAQGFCDTFELAPKTIDEGYLEWLLRTITKYRIDFLIPGIEADLYAWNDYRTQIESTGAKILLNNPNLITLCKDKWLFYEALEKIDKTHLITSSLSSNFNTLSNEFGLPFLLKPRQGFGSKGIKYIENEAMFLPHQHLIGEILMAQPIIGNEEEEFTTSAFCDGAGGFYASMTLKRKLSNDGFTDRAEVIKTNEANQALISLCAYFKPVGPTNFQFRKHNGTLKLLEINPRISSSTSIRSAFGYNEAIMALEYYLYNKAPVQPTIQSGRAVRYVEDLILKGNVTI